MRTTQTGYSNAGQRPRRVALAFPASVPWLARCLEGIAEYAQAHGGWNFVTSPPTLGGAEELALTPFGLKGWPGDGAIAVINDPAEARAAKRLSIPVVDLAGTVRRSDLPRVMVDHYAIGRLAASHLLARGLGRLAYYGIAGPWYSEQRRRGFVDRAREDGVECDSLEVPACHDPKAPWARRTASLVAWLATLRPPVGILAAHDYRARVLVDECLNLGLRIPHDVAVLGVDNDTTVCESCQPTLSSVARDARQIGWEAAALLDRLIDGAPWPSADLLIPPAGVVERRSTDTIVVEHPHVREAIQYIHDHLGEPLTVEALVRQTAISRRLLEKQFRTYLGCTPRDYMVRLRIERAKRHLASTERIKMPEVARACGFSDVKRFRVAFTRLTGQTPTHYRRLAQQQ